MRARINLTIGFVSFAFMLIVALLLAGTAFADLPRKVEAETGPTQTVAAPHTDSASTPTSASPNSYRFTGNGGLRFFFTTAAGEQVTSIVMRAKVGGTSPSGSDLVFVANGVNIGTRTLTLSNTTYAEYSVSTNLSPGLQTIDIYAQDMQGSDKQIWDWIELRGTNSTPGDTTAPNTTITSGPANGSTDTDGSVSFGFSSSETGSTFECKLDESAYGACTSAKSYSGLENGDHTFSVRATDAAGNTDATPATRTFSVAVPDTTMPDSTIDSGPGNTSDGQASFTFSADEAATFECKLIVANTNPEQLIQNWTACTSPKSYSALADGSYTFRLRATDTANNVESPVTGTTFSVTNTTQDTTQPDAQITAGPAGGGQTISGNDPSFTFTGTDNVSTAGNLTFECSLELDGQPDSFAPCTSPKSYTDLPNGDYWFKVRAIDEAGNVESAPYGGVRHFLVNVADTTAPATSITAGPAEASTDTDGDVSFSFSSDESPSTFECRLELGGVVSQDWASCTTPKAYNDLADGSYTFKVKAKDSAGNVDATPSTRNFTIALPPTDTDNDGIPDTTDACDNDPGPASNNGCPVQQTGCDENITPSQNLATIVNGDSATVGTKFCLAAGTYNITTDLNLRNGDHLAGPVATMDSHGRADYAVPTAKINATGASRVISAFDSVEVEWVEITGADGGTHASSNPEQECPASPIPVSEGLCPNKGEGVGIAMGNADDSSVLHHLYVHDNDSSGIGNMHGRIKFSEFHNNTKNEAYLGVTASAVKGIVEYEAYELFVHDEEGNGVWLDHTHSVSSNQAEMSTNPGNGAWFHEIVVVDSGRKGLRHEFSPRDAPEGGTLPTPSIMIEQNDVHGNRDEGISVRDAQNATVRNNILGAKTIGGISYAENGDNNNNGAGDGVLVSDSGRSDRTDTRNITVSGNTLNGDEVRCTAPGAGISCQ